MNNSLVGVLFTQSKPIDIESEIEKIAGVLSVKYGEPKTHSNNLLWENGEISLNLSRNSGNSYSVVVMNNKQVNSSLLAGDKTLQESLKKMGDSSKKLQELLESQE